MNRVGGLKIEWAKQFMPVLMNISEKAVREQTFRGLRIGLVLHIEAKTAVLATRIQEAGAQVYVAASNPLTTQDDVVDDLKTQVSAVWAKRGESSSEYADAIRRVLDSSPNYLIDDGADCIVESHRLNIQSVKGASEETTTGVNRVRAMVREHSLRYPVVPLNDAFVKHLFDNRYGTGQSAADGLMRATNLLIAGKRTVVAGYGWVGRGIALRLRGLGARVTVTETDPVRALEAYMDGFEVGRLNTAVRDCEMLITATGNTHVVDEADFRVARDGIILANAGHFNVEVDMAYLDSKCSLKRQVRPNVDEYTLNGKKIYVIAQGRLVNIAAADGHPVEVMDMSFSGQFSALEYLCTSGDNLSPRLHKLPRKMDLRVAKTFLKAHGVYIDSLTRNQRRYIGSY